MSFETFVAIGQTVAVGVAVFFALMVVLTIHAMSDRIDRLEATVEQMREEASP